VLIDGYRRVLAALYPPDLASYFARCWTLLSNLGPGVATRRRAVKPAELLALLRSLRRQVFSRQAPAYLGFLLRTLLRCPRQFPQAMGLAIMGLHFEKFTRQTLAAHDFNAAARTGYGEVEREAAAAVAPPAPGTAPQDSPQKALRRHADRAVRRLRRLHRRLRPEFRKGLSPDLAGVEQAIQACVREAPALEPLQRIQPQVEQWFAGPSWRGALEAHGYALAERWRAGARTLTLAPLLAQGTVRRALESFLGELGVQVMTWREQVAHLGEESLQGILGPGDAPDSLVSYLRALGRRADTLIVPLVGDLDETAERVQLLSPQASSGAALPQVVGVACNSSRRQLRASLIELGAALTGDPGRAEIAFDRAFALL